jgi:filamentous hemagglutinin family protein
MQRVFVDSRWLIHGLIRVGFTGLGLVGWGPGGHAQEVVRDTTLSIPTRVERTGDRFDIFDGTPVGRNLFHSFSEFSVPTNGAAIFNNAANIQTIFSRVTGATPSSINGLIQTNGGASLFLLNPNGILFGPNARLNIGGSFVATTADSIRFDNGFAFSASNPTSPPLLTMSVPLGVQFGATPGAIVNRSVATANGLPASGSNPAVGLRVGAGQLLGFIGGDVDFPGGRATANGDRIEIGSVGANGRVDFGPAVGQPTRLGPAFDYPEQPMGTISLQQWAAIYVSGPGAGSVYLHGGQIRLRQMATINANTRGANSGGQIGVTATESLEMTDVDPSERFATAISAIVLTGATGQGAEITIATPQLSFANGAQIISRTRGAGAAGPITIHAQDVQATGSSPSGAFASGIVSRTDNTATGRGADVTITARRVQLIDGAEFRASTRGNGRAGNFTVRAQELTTTSTPSTQTYTGISTSARSNSNDEVATGRGGDIVLEVDRINILGGSAIRTGTDSGGRAGDITIRAKAITLQGEDVDGFVAELFTRSEGTVTATGHAGDIQIDTDTLTLASGARLYTNASGLGNAGNLQITARRVDVVGTALDDAPSLIQTATLTNGQGGNLTLNVDQLQLAQGGQMASVTLGAGNAGNVTIDARSMDIIGLDASGQRTSGIYASTESRRIQETDPNTGATVTKVLPATGNGGLVTLRVQHLRLADGGLVKSSPAALE